MQKRLFGVLAVGLLSLLFLGVNFCQAETSSVFFPEGKFSEQPDADRANRTWYAKCLSALKESSIYELRKDQKTTIIRFLCVRTYQDPFVVRIEKNGDGTGNLAFKQSSGDGGYQLGKLVTNKTVKLNKKQMADVIGKMEEKQLFSMKNQGGANGDLEASRWLIEGVHNGKYHLVERCSPGWGGFRQLGSYLLNLSGEKIKNLD